MYRRGFSPIHLSIAAGLCAVAASRQTPLLVLESYAEMSLHYPGRRAGKFPRALISAPCRIGYMTMNHVAMPDNKCAASAGTIALIIGLTVFMSLSLIAGRKGMPRPCAIDGSSRRSTASAHDRQDL